MELIRLEFPTFRDFQRAVGPRLTPDGLWVAVEEPPPLGAEVGLEIDLADGFRLLRARGQVVARLAAGEPGARGVALRFLLLDPASRLLVERMLNRHGAEGGSRFVLPASPELEEVARQSAEAPAIAPPPPAEAPAAAADAWVPPAPIRVEEPVGPLLVAEVTQMLAAGAARPAAALEEERQGRRREDRRQRRRALAGPPPRPARAPWGAAAARERRDRRALGRAAALAAALAVVAVLAARVAWRTGSDERSPAAPPPAAAARERPSPAPVAAAPAAAGSPAAPPAAAVGAAAPFDRVESVARTRQGEATILTLRLNGAAQRDRWRTERITQGATREVVKLSGVAVAPRPAAWTFDDPLVRGLRSGLHGGPQGPELHLVADLAGPSVRLAGVEAGRDSLRLTFVRAAGRDEPATRR